MVDRPIDTRESVKNIKGFKTIVSDSIINFSSKILSNIFYFLFITFLAKSLGDTVYTQYGYFLMVAQFLYLVFLVWLQNGMLITGRQEFLETNKINRTFTANLLLILPIIIALIFSLFALKKIVFGYLHYGADSMIILLCAYFILNYISEIYYYSLQSVGEIKIMSTAQAIEKAAPFFIIIIIYFFYGQISLNTAIAVLLSGFFFSQLYISLRTKLSYFLPLKFDKKLLKKFFDISAPIFFGSAVGYALTWADMGIMKDLRHLFSDAEISSFFYCQLLVNGVNQTAIVLLTILLPLTISLIVKNRKDLLNDLLSGISIIFMTVIFFCINLLWFLMHFVFIYILKKNNIFEISFVLNIMLISAPLTIFLNVLSALINGYELLWGFSINNIVSVTVKILVSYFLILKFGIVGGGLGTIACKIVSIILYKYILRKQISVPLRNVMIFMCFMLLCSTLFLIIKNIYICFVVNNILLFAYIKIYRVFDKTKIQILDKLDIPVSIKSMMFRFFGYLESK